MPMDLSQLSEAQLRRELQKREQQKHKGELGKHKGKSKTPSGHARKRESSRKTKKDSKANRRKEKEEEKKTIARRAERAERMKAFEEKYAKKYDITWKVLSSKKTRIWDKSVSNTYLKVRRFPLTESTVKYISWRLNEIAVKEVRKVKAAYPAGANVYMKVLLESEGVIASAVIKLSDVNERDLHKLILRELYFKTNKMYPTADYFLDVTQVMLLVSGFGSKGGCHEGKTQKLTQEVSKDVTIHFTNHKSTGNNCLIQCFNHAYGVSGRELKAAKVRSRLGLKKGKKIHMDDIEEMSQYYNKKFNKQMGYILVNQSLKILKFSHPSIKKASEYKFEDVDDRENVVQLCLKNNHYFTYSIVTYRRCEVCGERLLSTNTSHKCDKNRASFYSTQISKKKDMVRSVKIDEPKIDYEKIVHWDLETFQPADGGLRHEIYASGFYDHKYKVYYGKDAGDKTIDRFLKFENRTISAYNGSGFDYTFLIDSLTARGACIENMIMNNGRIMSFNYHIGDSSKKNKIFDLYLFTMTGLSAACDDFKVSKENSKGDFVAS